MSCESLVLAPSSRDPKDTRETCVRLLCGCSSSNKDDCRFLHRGALDVHLGCLPHIPHNPHWIERLCTSGGASSLPVHPADDPCARANHKGSPAKLDDL